MTDKIMEWLDAIRDRIADELTGRQVGAGYYATSVGPDDAYDMAQAVIDELGLTVEERKVSSDREPERTSFSVSTDRSVGIDGVQHWYNGVDVTEDYRKWELSKRAERRVVGRWEKQ